MLSILEIIYPITNLHHKNDYIEKKMDAEIQKL